MKPRNAKVSGLPGALAVIRCEAVKFNQAGFIRMERQHERLKPRTHRVEKAACIFLVFEARGQSGNPINSARSLSGTYPLPRRLQVPA